MMHGHEKSDPAIVAVKPANKTEQPAAERSAVESTVAGLLHRAQMLTRGMFFEVIDWSEDQATLPIAE